jgi:hypothetical protein
MSETETIETEVTTEVTEDFTWTDNDGNFSEGWKDRLPEEIRGEKGLNNVKSIPDVMKQLTNAQKAIGKDKIALPNENSSPEEWEETYKALGRPETVDDYIVEFPDEVKDYVDPELMTEAKSIFHKIGLNKTQADALMAFEASRIAKGLEGQKLDAENSVKETEEALRKEWGTSYPERLHVAERVITENTTEENREALLSEIGNSPRIADFLATIGKKFMEGKIMTGVETLRETPAEALDAIAVLKATEGYMTGELKSKNRDYYNKVQRDITEKYKLAYPSK